MVAIEPTTLGEAAHAALAASSPSVVRIGRAPGRGGGIVVVEGHVLTNAHNLRDRTTEVTFADGRAVQAGVTAVDPDGDLVVLEVDTAGAPALVWASETADAGEVVFAVGRTADGGARVTFGMVSGVERAFRGPRGRQITGSLEHTAPLPRGSSGSPVVDGHGHLVALNTARLADGFYLALPADAALRTRVDALVRGESVQRLVLGVGLAPAEVARQLRASVGLTDQPGLLVRTVEADSPADQAGLKVGDLITTAGDQRIAEVDDLHRALDAARDTRTLSLHLLRGAEEQTVKVSFPS
ncbi:MAG: trypsin-like peptidase domain-containing protein [Acidimicrobiales bacterium]